ncbi:TolC family protein [Desulfuromonas sp.]|uniref:TolC family protein n=1 Tax=Desulfuromonas sp. TaxID=892 RepID=UPI0025C559E1|nr:TolC family protein [Desulfuromonas sp.]
MKRFSVWIKVLGLILALSPLTAPPSLAKDYIEGLDEWPVMPLRTAVQLGLEQNFDLRAGALNPAIADRDHTAAEARFDVSVDAAVSAQGNRQPERVPLIDQEGRSLAAEAGLSKVFRTGLDGRLSLQTARSSDNLAQSGRSPEYATALLLDLTQPLLRDFGSSVNTADLRIADTRRRHATLGYLDQAQRVAEAIESGYFDLAQAIETYRYRIESRDLAQELLEGNREKLEAGIIPVSEVQEAETAVAARDELVLLARQEVETAGNRLKGLLGIKQEYPLSRNFYRTEPMPGPDQPFPQVEQALEQALDDRPDLASRRLEVENRQIRLEFDRNQTLPRLDLQATLAVNGLSGEDGAGTSSRRDYIDSLDGMAGADGYGWFAGVGFSYPLENRAAKALHDRSRLEKRQAVYDVKGLETTVETEIINALIRVKRGLERVRVAGRFEALADLTLKQEMERLVEGLSDTFRILDFQDDVIDARIRNITAQADVNRGLASLHRAMGNNLERLGVTVKTFDKEQFHE